MGADRLDAPVPLARLPLLARRAHNPHRLAHAAADTGYVTALSIELTIYHVK
jgi:hypothetical protein